MNIRLWEQITNPHKLEKKIEENVSVISVRECGEFLFSNFVF